MTSPEHRTLKIRSEGVPLSRALALVECVVKQGRISTSRFGPSYCHASTFASEAAGETITVFASRTMTLDTFTILRQTLSDHGTNS